MHDVHPAFWKAIDALGTIANFSRKSIPQASFNPSGIVYGDYNPNKRINSRS